MKLAHRRAACLAACVCLAAASSAGAQGFQGLYTRDGADVMAVGDNGQTYRSLNGGSSWWGATLGSLTLRDVTGRGVTYLVVGDQGTIWKSVDAGGSWTSSIAPSSPNLRATAMVTDLVWVVAGGGGTILRSIDAGANWNAVTSGTSQTLNSLKFTDALNGWAAGDGGTLLQTADGGASWTPVAVGTTQALLSVDQRGGQVWVVGENGTARRSANGGASFAAVNLKLDARADVTGVTMVSADSVTLVGGGGFIRSTVDGGATWSFARHSLLAPITRVIALGDKRWVANSMNRLVMVSTDRGVTWQTPSGTTTAQTWIGKYAHSGVVRGSGFALNPVYKNTIYCGIGSGVARSRNDGFSWVTVSTFPSGYLTCNAFMVSPKDSNLWLAAVAGSSVSDRVFRSTDAGANWTAVLTNDFGEYGIPLEMDPDRPDTVWFGGEAGSSGSPMTPLYQSFDFGATWHTLPGALFRSPCDLEALPDTSGILIVGDGVTGSGQGKYWKSTDGGATFTLKATRTSSEIPGLATSRLRRNAILGTNWSAGGVQRSTDYGDTWPTVDATAEAWAIDIAKDDPNVVLFGQYFSPYNSQLSLNGGDSFSVLATPGTFGQNYGHYIRDRATIFAEQSSGIWQLQTTLSYTPGSPPAQSLQLTSPVGGETWNAGSTHDITWNGAGLAAVRIEYRRTPAEPWQRVADTGATPTHFAWHVPLDATTQARIRVRDLWDAAPIDSSHATFTIVAALYSEAPDTLHLSPVQVGHSARVPLTLGNAGNAPLTVTGITVGNPEFWVGRTSLSIPAGAEDTVGVYYQPAAEGADTTLLTLATDDPAGPHVAVAEGLGVVSLAVDPTTPERLALGPNRPNPFAEETLIEYTLPRAAEVTLDVFDLHGQRVAGLVHGREAAGRHQVRFALGARNAMGRGGRLASGVYFCRLQAGSLSATRKILAVH